MNLEIVLDNLINWGLIKGIKIVVILISALIFIFLSKIFIKKILKNFKKERITTITKVFYSGAKTIIWIITILTLLPEFGVNIGPLLAGVGIVGLALGFGARNLVQDYISGLFILIEDQYRIGEKVEIGGVKGKVKDFNLRRTVIEEESGVLSYIPNSQIKKTSNFSRKKRESRLSPEE